MKILILEDDAERIKLFRQNLIGHDLDITDSSKQAIKLLKSNKYNVIFLDHDLGGKQNVASGEDTGYEVALWLSKNPERKPNQIIIHSYNPVGRQNMKAVLPDAIIAPGVWLQKM